MENMHDDHYNMFKRLLTEIPMIIYAMDNDWNFTLSDGRGLQKLGLRPGEVVGRNGRQMYETIPSIITALEDAYRGKTVHMEHELGDLILEDYIMPIYSKYGKIEGVIGAAMDITPTKKYEQELRKSQELLQALIDSVPGLFYLYNSKGELIFWNKQHEIFTGYTSEELDHFTLMDWYPNDPESQNSVMKGLEATATQGFGDAEANLTLKDGSKVFCYFTACPLNIDGEDCFVGIGYDISKRKAMEEELRELNRTLEEKVIKRTEELSSANNELSLANQELTALNEEMIAMNDELMNQNDKIRSIQEFLVESEKMAALGGLVAGVAHEVNTPIGVGITASTHLTDMVKELLMRQDQGDLSQDDLIGYLEDIQSASEIIDKNLARAGKLVQSFKRLSTDQSSEPVRQFDAGKYLDEILISLSPTLKKSPITIATQSEERLIIHGSPGAFSQIITNLVMNAFHHAFEEYKPGTIDIHLSSADNPDMIQLTFKDNGYGMTPEVQKKIFDPFFTTMRGSGGTGLGLSIVHNIVTQQFKGSIQCHSTEGEGTTFVLLLSKKGGV